MARDTNSCHILLIICSYRDNTTHNWHKERFNYDSSVFVCKLLIINIV